MIGLQLELSRQSIRRLVTLRTVAILIGLNPRFAAVGLAKAMRFRGVGFFHVSLGHTVEAEKQVIPRPGREGLANRVSECLEKSLVDVKFANGGNGRFPI